MTGSADPRGSWTFRRRVALAQLVTKQSRKLLTSMNILSEDELNSRYHVRLEVPGLPPKDQPVTITGSGDASVTIKVE